MDKLDIKGDAIKAAVHLGSMWLMEGKQSMMDMAYTVGAYVISDAAKEFTQKINSQFPQGTSVNVANWVRGSLSDGAIVYAVKKFIQKESTVNFPYIFASAMLANGIHVNIDPQTGTVASK